MIATPNADDLMAQALKSRRLETDPTRYAIRSALAWGCTYGPRISMASWDTMADKMVDQFAAEVKKKDPVLVAAAKDVIFWDGHEHGTAAFALLEQFVFEHTHHPAIVAEQKVRSAVGRVAGWAFKKKSDG